MPKIREEFTEDNFLSLALACVEAGERIKDAYDDGIDSIIVPSRGACPIVRGIIKAIGEYARERGEEYVEIYEALQLPPFLEKEYDSMKGRAGNKKLRNIRVIPYPLTADVSLPENLLKSYGITLDYVTDSIRNYGAEVIASLRLNQKEREKNDKFNFLTFIFEDVEGREEDANFYRNLDQINYPLIVDTVISGRSLSTIAKNLSEHEVKYSALGIVDVNGMKLKPEYLKILSSSDSGRIELIKVERILSEDRGASLLGVIGCIYPNLALEAQEELDIRPCGSVTWHHIPLKSKNKVSQEMKRMSDTHYEVFRDYIGALYDGIELLLRKNPDRDTENRMRERINRVVGSIEEHKLLHHYGELLDHRAFVKDNIGVEEIDESSSHVVHILLSQEGLRECLKNYRRKYGNNTTKK